MKILAIRGKNIASLEDEFEIDFQEEPLKSAGLYVVTGPTGSGKSTLLDVIALALYGTTPRLKLAPDTDIADSQSNQVTMKSPYTLLRRGSTFGYAEVDFQGIDNDVYRVRWSAKRARNDVDGKWQKIAVTLYNVTRDLHSELHKKSDIEKEIVRLTDLTYDQFSRTVLLAQGEFASFLKANESERASLLEKLTGTEIYARISERIFRRHSEEQKEFESILRDKAQLNLLSEEELATLNQQKGQLNDESASLEKELKILELHQRWLLDYKLLRDNQNQEQIQATQLKRSWESDQYKREQVLFRESVEPLVVPLQQIKDLQKNLSDTDRQLADLLTKKQELQTVSMQESEKLQTVEENYSQSEKQQPEFRRKMDSARELNTKIQYIEGQVSTRERDTVTIVDSELKPLQQDLTLKSTQQLELQNEIKRLEKWFQDNSDREGIAQNFAVISDNLHQASRIMLHMQQQQQSLDKLLSEKSPLATQRQQLNSELKEIDSVLLQFSQELAKLDIGTVEMQTKDSRLAIDQSIARQANLQHLIQLLSFQSTLQQDLQKNSELTHLKQQELVQACDKIRSLEVQKTELEITYLALKNFVEKTRVSVSENVKELRANLVPGDPCPVCGSTEHVYQIQGETILKKELQRQLNELAISERKFSEHKELLIQQITLVSSIEKSILELDNSAKELNAKISNYQSEVGNYASFLPSKDLSIEQQVEKLDLERIDLVTTVDQQRKKIEELEAIISHANKLTKLISDNQLLKDKSTLTLTSVNMRLAEIEAEEKSILRSISHDDQQINDSLNKVNHYFNNQAWKHNWSTQVDQFMEKIELFAQQWQQSCSRKIELEQLLKVSITQTDAYAKQIHELTQRLALEKKKIEVDKNELSNLKHTLLQFFGRLDLDVIENENVKQSTALKQQLDSARKTYQDTLQEIVKTNTLSSTYQDNARKIISQLEKTQENLQHQFSQLQQTLARPVDLDTVEALLQNEKQTIQYKQDIELLKDRISKSEARLDLITQKVEEHLKSRTLPNELDETNELCNQIKSISDQKKSELLSLNIQLAQQQQDRSKFETLLQKELQQREVLKNWQILNAEIGQASGDKFKKIAQGYTLDLLLMHANRQMQQIASRYVLKRVPNTLALQVVDQDMCDQVRSVYSLSGGESFLVSLAMALGLASLSTRQIRLESLFIDEGFGTLDQQSLAIALDALESLRLQGRKIGVITHVKEMTERIATCIRVERKQNGASSISIQYN